MAESKCDNCEVFKQYDSGELMRTVAEKHLAEVVRIADLQSEEAVFHSTNALKADIDSDIHSLKMFPVFAKTGICKGPTFFKHICRNAHEQRLFPKVGNF